MSENAVPAGAGGVQVTANERFKRSFGAWFWGSMILATVIHFTLFAAFPELTAEDVSINTEQLEAVTTPNTKAILPVHMFGRVAEMDKLTQSNAANAEESASASEEMSAQAEQMKDVVGDLRALDALVDENAVAVAEVGEVGRLFDAPAAWMTRTSALLEVLQYSNPGVRMARFTTLRR